jgi:hypothetical protein
LWFIGWDDDTGLMGGVGHATSPDGIAWTMDPANPVLTRGDVGDWDEYLWAPALAVVFDGDQFHMWYSGTSETSGSPYRGGYATSPDGSVWTKYAGNPVMDVGPSGSWDDRHVRPDEVILDGGIYKMWYTGYDGSTVLIGYADSEDGIVWTKHPDPVIGELSYPGVWDERAANPSVAFDGSLYHMWYMGLASSVGDWMVGYAFSTDGIEWIRHRYNPVISSAGEDIVVMPVVFDGVTWHGWYFIGLEGGLDNWRVRYATSTGDPGVPGWTDLKYIPAAAYAAGAEGSFYETDLDLSNADDQAVDYEFWWLPRGQSNSDPTTSDTFTLGAGMSVRYSNVLAEVFDLEPDAFGALALRSTSPDLMAMARIANVPQDTGEGSFGQAIPALTVDDFTGMHERRRLLFGTENADMRFNVGCLNADTRAARVNFELYRSDGTLLGSESVILMPFDNNQLNRIFDPYHPAVGYVDYWSAASSGRIWCYGSVLDNVTSDPTTVPPQ